MNPLPFSLECLFYLIVLLVGTIILVLYVLRSKNNYEKFEENNYKKPLFYMFYTEWCGHSQKMLPEWNKLTTEFSNSIDFKLVNCEKDNTSKNMCSKFKIKYLPTLIFLKQDGTQKIYNGDADINNLISFTEEQIKNN